MAPWGVERRYWSRLEVPFRLALEGLPQDREETLTAWQQTLRRTAWEVFDGVAEDVETDPAGAEGCGSRARAIGGRAGEGSARMRL